MSKPEGSRTGKYPPGCQAKKLSEIVKFIKKCTAMERELDLRIPSLCVCVCVCVCDHMLPDAEQRRGKCVITVLSVTL